MRGECSGHSQCGGSGHRVWGGSGGPVWPSGGTGWGTESGWPRVAALWPHSRPLPGGPLLCPGHGWSPGRPGVGGPPPPARPARTHLHVLRREARERLQREVHLVPLLPLHVLVRGALPPQPQRADELLHLPEIDAAPLRQPPWRVPGCGSRPRAGAPGAGAPSRPIRAPSAVSPASAALAVSPAALCPGSGVRSHRRVCDTRKQRRREGDGHLTSRGGPWGPRCTLGGREEKAHQGQLLRLSQAPEGRLPGRGQGPRVPRAPGKGASVHPPITGGGTRVWGARRRSAPLAGREQGHRPLPPTEGWLLPRPPLCPRLLPVSGPPVRSGPCAPRPPRAGGYSRDADLKQVVLDELLAQHDDAELDAELHEAAPRGALRGWGGRTGA